MSICIDCGSEELVAKLAYTQPGIPGVQTEVKCYVREVAKGCVISKREYNGYDDSDFFATYWDEGSKEPKEIEYSTTRAGSCGSSTIDATPEVLALYRQWRIDKATKQAIQDDIEASKTPSQGKQCKVIKGRKVSKGTVVDVIRTEERVFRFASGPFGTEESTQALCWVVKDGVRTQVWTNVDNLEVINSEKYLHTEAELREQVTRMLS